MCNDDTFIRVMKNFNYYYMPIIVSIGLAGNVLSIVVFMTTALKRIPATYYLTALAVVDCCLLLVNLFNLAGGVYVINKPGWCQVSQYVSNVLHFLSVWFVVGFTVERFVAVRFPLRRNRWCTRERSRIIVKCLIFLSFSWNVYIICITEAVPIDDDIASGNETTCTSPERYWEIVMILNYVDTSVTFLAPFLIIVLLNSSTSIKILRKNRRRNNVALKLLEFGPNSSLIALAVVKTVHPLYTDESRRYVGNRLRSKEGNVTKVLLLISFVFLVMNLPDHTLRLLASIWYRNGYFDEMDPIDFCRFLRAQQIANIVFNTNFATNFVLYNLVGKNFRRYVKEFLSGQRGLCKRRPNLNGHSATNQTSSSPSRRFSALASF